MEKIIYAILKEIQNNENRIIRGEETINLTANTFGITREAFGNAILAIEERKYAKVSYNTCSGLPNVIFDDSTMLLENGIKYLKDNSIFSKAYKGLKEIKEWLS